MAKKKGRDCIECIAYCNILGGEEYTGDIGYEVVEDVEGARCGLQLYIGSNDALFRIPQNLYSCTRYTEMLIPKAHSEEI